MKRILGICGPTSSGKTDLAHKLAKKISGEIVNADAMQIYKEFPILTNSPSQSNMKEIKYHLYNFLEIKTDFSVKEYCLKASKTINDIISRNKIPIIVSGSGFYLNSLLLGYHSLPNISEENKLRLQKDLDNYSNLEIHNKLISCDKRFEKLNKNDVYRIRRAYAIFLQTGESIYNFYNEKNFISSFSKFKKRIFFIKTQRDSLNTEILKRIETMLKSGTIKEVQNFLSQNNNILPKNVLKIIGTEEIKKYLDNHISINSLTNQIFLRTKKYAKRQDTWFRNQLLNLKDTDKNLCINIIKSDINSLTNILNKIKKYFE
ncbi:MAG: tRNA (adenosine(37)-N6)-dimethylallyltransferase MiaA [Rickettsia sp.]|nr:tRNA (adenosine(37)-N6)-dimethylallyltransferase MiaA [Rickettsia sp.]